MCAGLMWRAPELLRQGRPVPEGSQKGDVYSFAIILYELYGRKGPWGETHLSSSGACLFSFPYIVLTRRSRMMVTIMIVIVRKRLCQ